MNRNISEIVIHCSATPPSMDIGAREIRSWHLAKGWRDIGYHFVVRRDGKIELGRPLEQTGAHVRGFNANSIGICYVGGVNESGHATDTRTEAQNVSLELLVRTCMRVVPGARVQGHRDFPNVSKACPSFNVKAWVDGFTKPKRAQKKPVNKAKHGKA